MKFQDELTAYHKAGYAALYVVTPEETRLEREIGLVAKQRKLAFWRWSVTEGWREVPNGDEAPGSRETTDPIQALRDVRELPEEGVYVLRDYHFFLENPEVIRSLKDLLPVCRTTGRLLVFVAARLVLPPELAKELTVVEYRLPTREDLDLVLAKVLGGVKEKKIAIPDRRAVLESSLGMTGVEAENAFALALVKHKALGSEAVATIHREKVQVVKKSGLLEVVEPAESLESVGGLDRLKGWLGSRAKAFSEDAREFGLPVPKGVLVIGVPGTGKSLTGKCVARSWNLPLLRLDMGRLFGGIVGESESNARQVLRQAEDMSPTVLWVDEIEKGAAGMGGSGSLDSGVTARVLGTILTWLQDKTAPVFLFATANRVDALPPELLRKGRFDEIFWLDLPDADEREQIFVIHLRKRGWLRANIGPRVLAADAKDFTGAEIEQAVIAGLFKAFDAGRDLQETDIREAIRETVPLVVTMKEDIRRMRDWARTRAVPASTRSDEQAASRRLEVDG